MTETDRKRKWLIDGSNVIHCTDPPSVRNLEMIVRELRRRNIEFEVFCDSSTLMRLGIKEQELGRKLNAKVNVVSDAEADEVMLKMVSKDPNLMILTNDRFEKWKENFPVLRERNVVVNFSIYADADAVFLGQQEIELGEQIMKTAYAKINKILEEITRSKLRERIDHVVSEEIRKRIQDGDFLRRHVREEIQNSRAIIRQEVSLSVSQQLPEIVEHLLPREVERRLDEILRRELDAQRESVAQDVCSDLWSKIEGLVRERVREEISRLEQHVKDTASVVARQEISSKIDEFLKNAQSKIDEFTESCVRNRLGRIRQDLGKQLGREIEEKVREIREKLWRDIEKSLRSFEAEIRKKVEESVNRRGSRW